MSVVACMCKHMCIGFVIEREEGSTVAGVEDNKFIASAARLVFPVTKTLEHLRRKILLKSSKGEN